MELPEGDAATLQAHSGLPGHVRLPAGGRVDERVLPRPRLAPAGAAEATREYKNIASPACCLGDDDDHLSPHYHHLYKIAQKKAT